MMREHSFSVQKYLMSVFNTLNPELKQQVLDVVEQALRTGVDCTQELRELAPLFQMGTYLVCCCLLFIVCCYCCCCF